MGVLGIIDVAKYIGIQNMRKKITVNPQSRSWPGCYILPVLGPSTARDTVSAANFLGGDAWYNVTVRNDTNYFKDADYYSSRLWVELILEQNFDSIENLEKTLDFYASVKSLYLQDRQQKIANTKQITNTQDDSDWEEIENK